MKPRLITIDFESVLVPEAWIAIADALDVPEMRVTTKEEPDFSRLMATRTAILRERGITLKSLQHILADLEPLPGSVEFFAELRAIAPTIIVSDSFMEFTWPQVARFTYPAIFCHTLTIDAVGHLTGYRMRKGGDKRSVIRALQQTGFSVTAMGDSFNDVPMLKQAEQGALLFSDAPVRDANPNLPTLHSYAEALAFAEGN